MRSDFFGIKKRLICCVLSLSMIMSVFIHAASADEPSGDDRGTEAFPVDSGSVLSAALYHPDTDTMLFSLNANEELPVAGLTRMAPMLMVAEAVDRGDFSLESSVQVSREAAKVKGPTAFVEANENIKAEHLFKSAAMIGAGDAVYALIEAAFGSTDAFLPALNTRMSELGVYADYRSPLGDDEKLSAESLAILGAGLSNTKLYSAYSSLYMDKIIHENGKETELVNPNRLIRDFAGCTGLATGSSNSAGYSGVFSATRGNDRFICVVIGAKNNQERSSVAKSMLEYAFATYKTLKIIETGDIIKKDVQVSGSIKQSVDLIALEDCYVLTDGNVSKKDIRPCEDDIPNAVNAPASVKESIFILKFQDNDKNTVGEIAVGVSEDIEKALYGDYLSVVTAAWLNGSV